MRRDSKDLNFVEVRLKSVMLGGNEPFSFILEVCPIMMDNEERIKISDAKPAKKAIIR